MTKRRSLITHDTAWLSSAPAPQCEVYHYWWYQHFYHILMVQARARKESLRGQNTTLMLKICFLFTYVHQKSRGVYIFDIVWFMLPVTSHSGQNMDHVSLHSIFCAEDLNDSIRNILDSQLFEVVGWCLMRCSPGERLAQYPGKRPPNRPIYQCWLW